MNKPREIRDALMSRVAQKYERDGYKVYVEPGTAVLPFDLGAYHPDLLAMKSDHNGYVIEIKNKSAYASVDRLRELAEKIAQHEGWRFLLITGDDISRNESEMGDKQILLSWEQISKQKEKGGKLCSIGEYEGAFLILWGTLEAMMRKQAEKASLPIERFPAMPLIKHLYSQGELSIEQFDRMIELLNIRNQYVHGFQTTSIDEACHQLADLVNELFNEWHPGQGQPGGML